MVALILISKKQPRRRVALRSIFLEKHVDGLSTIIAITPLMGLLGTVLGMIDVFQVVADKGVGSPMDMAVVFGRRY